MNHEKKSLNNYSIKSDNCCESENISRNSTNFCQACLNNNKSDNFKDMSRPYPNEDSTEVYSEMMNYCFALQIEGNERKKTENLYLICESCIKALRQTVSFRRQVEAAQKNIKKMCQENENALQLSTSKVNEDSSDTEYSGMERNELLSFLDDEDDSTSTDESIPKMPIIIKKKLVKNNKMMEMQRKGLKTAASRGENTLSMVKKISLPKVWTHKSIKIESGELSTGEKTSSSHDDKSEEESGDEDTIPIARISSRYHHLPYALDKLQLQCKICNITFETHRNLQIHMPEHFPNFFCSHCGRGFANRAQLTRHENIHSTERFECPHCPGKLFKTNDSKYEHIKRKHSDNPTIHRCPHCNDHFVSYYLRQKHLMKVHGETKKQREFKCKQCSKTFSTTSHRSIHVRRLHLNERNHSCNTCGKSFFSNQCLSRHMVMHTVDKNFPCHICPKSFQRKYTLTEHLKTHKNENS